MKIAFIGQKGIPAIKPGGVERHVEELATRLAERNHEIFAYVRNNYTEKQLREYAGIKLIHLPSIGTKHMDAISHTLFATLHALFCNYDVIHYHSIGPSSLSFIIKILKPKTVLVATYHSQDYFHQKWGAFAKVCLKLAEYVTCNIPDKTIAISQSLGRFVRKNFQKEAVVIPNGFSVAETEKTDELEKWGLVRNEYILSVSRLVRHKGIHFLIEAYKKLYDRNLHCGKKLVIVGDSAHTNDYVKFLHHLSAGNKSIIFTGAQSGSALSQLFSHAYLFVQPSQSEGLSIALLESQGYGKTALVSGIPENLEAIGSNGFAFRSGDIKDLENKLEKLMREPALVYETGCLAKIEVGKKYDWEKITTQTESLYKSLINHKIISKQNARYAQV